MKWEISLALAAALIRSPADAIGDSLLKILVWEPSMVYERHRTMPPNRGRPKLYTFKLAEAILAPSSGFSQAGAGGTTRFALDIPPSNC